MKRLNLIKFRIDLGLKSKDVAEKLGITKQHYSNIENGKVNPTYSIMEKFGEVFEDMYEDIWELFKKAE